MTTTSRPKRSKVKLFPHQKEALSKMHNGCVLHGGTGSGKSVTGLAYYMQETKGKVPLYIITTAKKRDDREWESKELKWFGFDVDKDDVYVDSWNNIKKYLKVRGAFFIFDEQRAVGYGVWGKGLISIAKKNKWIMLSATPGDTWMDYMVLFIANGFYRNKSDFISLHVSYKRGTTFPIIDQYFGLKILEKHRNEVLVEMPMERQTIRHVEDIRCDFDRKEYAERWKTRFNTETNQPFVNAAEMCQFMRKIVNRDESRQVALLEIFEKHPRLIVFYNYNFELDILKSLNYGPDVLIAEWNGHKHQPCPNDRSDKWIYFVQYTAGAEGWNCIHTDTIVFYSLNYSWKIMEQAMGRIDRMNNIYFDLYYYRLLSYSGIDRAIDKALNEKRKFNETKYTSWRKTKDGSVHV